MLADRNLAVLNEICDITYYIFTNHAGIEQLQLAPEIKLLSGYASLSINLIPNNLLLDNPISVHHTIWNQAGQTAKSDGAFIMFVPPDVAWSNGSFEHVAGLLDAGKEMIFMTYLRAESTSFTEALLKQRKKSDIAIAVSGEKLVEICIHSLHPIMAASMRESSYFPVHPEMMIWVVPHEGVLCRVLVREMFLYKPIDVSLNTVNLLETKLDLNKIHMVNDSSDLFAVSLDPIHKDFDWYRWPRAPDPLTIGEWWLDYDSWINDYIVTTKIRWHYRPKTELTWHAREQGADLFLRRAAAVREGRRLFSTARMLSCSTVARIIAVALETGVLARALRGRGGAIVFLPNDAAILEYSSIIGERCLEPGNESELCSLILRHFIPNALPNEPMCLLSQLSESPALKVAMADRTYLQVSKNKFNLELNGAKILAGPIRSGKNLVYVIDKTLGITASV